MVRHHAVNSGVKKKPTETTKFVASVMLPTRHTRVIVASFVSDPDVEEAISRLAASGLQVHTMSILGHNFENHEDIRGFYRLSRDIKPAGASNTRRQPGQWKDSGAQESYLWKP